MATFLLIIQIIGSIPTIIKIVREIWKYFQVLDKADKKLIQAELKEAIRRNKLQRTISAKQTIGEDLQKILSRLEEKHGKKNVANNHN